MDQGNKNHPQPPPLPGGGSGEPSSSGPPPVVEDASRASDPGETLADKGTGDPTAEFLRRAGAAIALDRGINARSRVKLAAIADELDLSEEQFDAAMEQLLGGAKAGDKREQSLTREELRQLRRRKRNFHNHVGETLMALPHGVLTSSMEQMLVRAGPEQFDLPEEEAQADVVQLAKKLRVRRITLEEAERHVAQLADYAVKPDGVLRPDVRKRIIAEASRWGLTPDQVQPILRDALSRARVGERRAQMRMVALVSGSAAVLVGVLGMIAWMAFSRALPEVDPPSVAVSEDDEVEAPTEEGEAASGVPLTRPKRLEVPAWWNDDLASYIANVRLRVPALESDLYQLRSPDANHRGAAYDRLLQATASGDLDDQQRTVLTGLFAAAYAVDPSEECAHRLRDGMMRIASAPSDGLPKRFSEYELSIWVAHTAFSALLNADISAERQSLLLDAIDRTFETALDRDLPPVQMQRQILGAAGGYLYRSLTRHAAKDVLLAVDLHKELLARVRTYLNPHAEDRLAANYLRQVLPELGERWQTYEDLIRRTTLSDDPLNVLLMLELYETTDVAALQSYLAAQLSVRTGITLTGKSVAELASAVRGELGVAESARPVDQAQRYAQWREAADELLTSEVPSAENTDELLQHIIESSRLSTLGAALAQGELGEAEFAELWDKPAPDLVSGGPRAAFGARRAPRLSASALKTLDKNIDGLRGYARLEKSRRLSYLQFVASFTGQVTDVQPQQGQDIAKYLTAAKPVDEHERVMTAIDGILRWRMVRLGLADALADSRLRTEHLAELLAKALHHEVDVEEDGWRMAARNELLANAAAELASEAALSGNAHTAPDRAAETLAGYYAGQAKLTGAAGSGASDADRPSDVLARWAETLAARLNGATLGAQQRARVSNVQNEIVAIEFMAENDITRTAAMQRLVYDLLRIETETTSPKAAGELVQIDRDLRANDAVAASALRQLAYGERATLECWLIRNQP